MQIRLLTPADAGTYQALRLEGLLEAPAAFGSSYEEERDLPLATVAARLAATPEKAVLGAFEASGDGSALAGVVGVMREDKVKQRHKASIWGMYVAPGYRDRRLGRRLMAEAMALAAAMPGLRQVTLCVNVSNTAAISLYEAMGFRRYGIEPEALYVAPDYHDKLEMVHMLPR
ncbi:N-acetyltransferase [Cupriavidus basilensis]|uniref:N-acetyltransferase n=1 Tax=Cupriavidus basilensis TaxID=68895 RepID=A0ABT6B4R6_9BURK|nr:N-acetyltransferase [Cupriavidus basilensis]MDF3839593.1 N-acetyltransferase [Cupriavidus basilensis]